jgi:hypothetical protein
MAPLQAVVSATPVDPEQIGPPRPIEAKTEARAEPAAPPPKVAPVATAAAAPAPVPSSTPGKPIEQKAETTPPEPAPAVTAAIPPSEPITAESQPANVVRKTEFGVDLGGANSIEGLRAVWRGALKVYSQQLSSLQPVIVVRERRDGLGMQLRLVAGPLSDAAEAAKLCAGFLTESNRPCETAVYDGQRLSMVSEKQPEAKQPEARPHRSKRKTRQRTEAAPEERPKPSAFSSFFGNR